MNKTNRHNCFLFNYYETDTTHTFFFSQEDSTLNQSMMVIIIYCSTKSSGKSHDPRVSQYTVIYMVLPHPQLAYIYTPTHPGLRYRDRELIPYMEEGAVM